MQYHPGFTLEERDGIYIYRITDITRPTVDAWYEIDKQQSITCAATTGHALRMWSIERMVFPTPYFTSKANLAMAETPDALYESTAVVIVNPLGFATLRAFFNRNLPERAKTAFRLFQSEAAAFEWLEERRRAVAQLLRGD